MKKYIRAIICMIYSSIKFSCIKILKGQNFKFSFYNIISPFTEIELDRGAHISLGRKIKMRSGSKIRARKKAKINIADNVSLNYGCIITAHEEIKIGENTQFGPNVLIYDHDHDFREKNGLKDLKYKTSPVEIGDNVWIGANVIILRGSKIGNNCVVGAGSIIKGEFEDNTLIVQKRENEIIKI